MKFNGLKFSDNSRIKLQVHCPILLLYTRIESLSRCEDNAKHRNTRDHLTWTIGIRIPCTRCVLHTVYLAHGNSKDEIR